jgi:hypothetical protein
LIGWFVGPTRPVSIRNQGGGTEESFNERDDAPELINPARAEATQPVLQRFRDPLDEMKPGPPGAPRRSC